MRGCAFPGLQAKGCMFSSLPEPGGEWDGEGMGAKEGTEISGGDVHQSVDTDSSHFHFNTTTHVQGSRAIVLKTGYFPTSRAEHHTDTERVSYTIQQDYGGLQRPNTEPVNPVFIG